MTATDPHANNVFTRLFTYAPQSEERAERENYCTEALAWCLISSKPFLSKFLNLIRERLGSQIRPRLKEFQGRLDVATQVSFKPDADRDQGDSKPHRRQFDLFIRSSGTPDFIVVIEVKVKPDKGLAQQVK